MNTASTFLLQFQETHPLADRPDLLCATQTHTATNMESSDQDPAGLATMLAGTKTVTNAIEESDQDASGYAPMFAATATMTKTTEDQDQDVDRLATPRTGTQTITETKESADADAYTMATQTHTLAAESPDSDASIPSYFAIPRATCSSS